MKKALIVATVVATDLMASKSAEQAQPMSDSWYAKLTAYWQQLGTHAQLGIQLVLVLLAIYAISCFFTCDKKCGCVGIGCNCSQVEKKANTLKDDCKCGLDCDTAGPDYKCDVKCTCKPACTCSPGCTCDENSNCVCDQNCTCGPHCQCGCKK